MFFASLFKLARGARGTISQGCLSPPCFSLKPLALALALLDLVLVPIADAIDIFGRRQDAVLGPAIDRAGYYVVPLTENPGCNLAPAAEFVTHRAPNVVWCRDEDVLSFVLRILPGVQQSCRELHGGFRILAGSASVPVPVQAAGLVIELLRDGSANANLFSDRGEKLLTYALTGLPMVVHKEKHL